MACYVVAYDLKAVGQNYDCIIERIQKFDNCHTQGSVWFVQYSGSAKQLREELKLCLDTNDRLFVSEVSKKWAGKTMSTCGEWLNKRGY